MPDNIGLFLGLTGAMFNGVDAQYLGLADYLINSNAMDDIVEQLLKTNWNRDSQNHKLLNNILSPLAIAEKNQAESLIVKHRVIIAELTKADNVFEIYQNIIDCDLSVDNKELLDSQWLEQAQKKIKNGSPLSCALIYQQLKQSENYTLAQCFKSELNLSLRCCQQKEFSEGVRALLVDKDRNPQWRYKNINDIDDKIIEWFFVPLSIK
jgi:enoyl-CoA hydratase/carnithine racemase